MREEFDIFYGSINPNDAPYLIALQAWNAGLESAAKMLDARATDLSKIPGSADSQTAFHLRHLARDIREAAK